MAFDKPTRNRLAKFVSDARGVIADEFTEQFQSLYGISAKGEIAPLERLGHLDEAGMATAALLRERIEYLEKTHPDDKDGTKAAVARLAREQAFTILNRLAAIRMAEKRGLIVESVGQGYQSRGFKVFETVAGSALGDTYHRYRRYLFCLFDELAIDLGILFDRRSPQALLFPREPALLALLDLLHAADLEPLWAEDETIGWIYQYYNDPEERKKMRKESAAPRNSRELAVRNQFFTPRYVVEFLTDNTLGRIWYEMTRGQTRLVEQCRYLVRRPTEIFLAEGESAPETPDLDLSAEASAKAEGLSQEELLKQPVHIPHRPLKDPREIRLLDPACGSMHFGLYAFDLFETIYEEAWDNGSCPALQEAYASRDEFLQDVPRLIIEHNIHGIDIDPRAVQIAGLSLWLRAQKAWQQQRVPAADRPRVRRSNIVCAEPMPGSPEMLEEFVATLKPDLLGELVKTVFDKMQLAGEAGSLLKIEEEIRTAIDTARKEWLKQQDDLLTRKDGGQEEFFDTAEQQVIDALRAYAEQADADSYQRRLFADDAARGFAFIDLCRKRYDAVVMNPPFGAFSKEHKREAQGDYPNSSNDIYAAFVDRFLLKLISAGLLGAITSRACFFAASFFDWRKHIIRATTQLVTLADLGEAVMDEAMVEAAAYVLRPTSNAIELDPTLWCREFTLNEREGGLLDSVRHFHTSRLRPRKSFCSAVSNFDHLESLPFVYWVDREAIAKLAHFPRLEPAAAEVRKGLRTGDNFRFVRCLWEIPNAAITPAIEPFEAGGDRDLSGFVPLVLSGSSQPWYSPLLVVLNWQRNGRELRTFVLKYGTESRLIQGKDFYFKPGISWTLRSTRFIPYAIPSGCIPTGSRPMAFSTNCKTGLLLAVTASNIASAFMRFYGEKFLWPKFLEGKLKLVPWPKLNEQRGGKLTEIAAIEVQSRRLAYRQFEPFHEFLHPSLSLTDVGSSALVFNPCTLLGEANERILHDGYGLTDADVESLQFDLNEAIQTRSTSSEDNLEDEDDDESSSDGGDEVIVDSSQERAKSLISYSTGTAFGRWDIRYATGERQPPELPDPFDPLPVCPPGMLQNAKGLPAEPKDVPADYPLRISWPGILVDDENHPEDIVARVREAIEAIWKDRAEAIEQEACGILGVKTLRDYFRRPAAFFADHLKRYSKSRRQAPIYWPLSTKSGSYTLWLYYHRLTDQTLHTCLADFLDPKLRKVQSELDALTASGGGGTRAGELREFLDELHDLRDEIERVIKLPWKPNLNDGVLITASPLHKLFRLPKWQKDLKACWDKLAKGDYDWAHLAYTIWPSRVEKACERDRSIAIAHGREDLCKVEPPKAKKGRGKKAAAEEQPEEYETESIGEDENDQENP